MHKYTHRRTSSSTPALLHISTELRTCLHTYIHTYIHACMHACIHTHTSLPPSQGESCGTQGSAMPASHMKHAGVQHPDFRKHPATSSSTQLKEDEHTHTYIHTYIQPYIHPYMHACMHAYIHACEQHTFMSMCMYVRLYVCAYERHRPIPSQLLASRQLDRKIILDGQIKRQIDKYIDRQIQTMCARIKASPLVRGMDV